MVFLKGLIFIFANIFVGYIFIFALKAFLFYPTKPKYYHGKKIPFTPGFLYRKQTWLINKLQSLLDDYIAYTQDFSKNSKVTKWEDKVYDKSWEKFEFFEKPRFIPSSIKTMMHYYASLFVFEFSRQFLRNFVPYLMERYNVQKYVDLADKKLDVDLILDFYNKKIEKYMLYALLAINGTIGLFNMIVYLIIH